MGKWMFLGTQLEIWGLIEACVIADMLTLTITLKFELIATCMTFHSNCRDVNSKAKRNPS